MDKVDKLKLSNNVSMAVLKNEFPVNGKTTISIIVEDNKVAKVEIRNTNSSKKKGE